MDTDFSNIDSKKAGLLQEFARLAEGKSTEELLPLILAFSNKAKSENIRFTKEETTLLFEEMKKKMSPEEQQKAEILIKMASVL